MLRYEHVEDYYVGGREEEVSRREQNQGRGVRLCLLRRWDRWFADSYFNSALELLGADQGHGIVDLT